jgi:hypothetical protein
MDCPPPEVKQMPWRAVTFSRCPAGSKLATKAHGFFSRRRRHEGRRKNTVTRLIDFIKDSYQIAALIGE